MESNMGIKVTGVSHAFKKQQVLKEVHATFEAGKIHGIVGNNGSGKTLLLKAVCGYLRPDTGEVTVFGKRIGKEMDFPESMGLSLEKPGFLPTASGAFNLRYLWAVRGKPDKERIKQVLDLVGLGEVGRKPVGKYSYGMKQRLAIAQAVMENPMLLILDEPFNGLDKEGVVQMRQLLKTLRSQGKTILLTSHNPQDIAQLCDTVCEMEAGELTVLAQR